MILRKFIHEWIYGGGDMSRLFSIKAIFGFSLLILASGPFLTVPLEFFSNSAMAGEVMPPRETPVNAKRTENREQFKKKSPTGRRGFYRPDAGFSINIEINRNRQNVKKNRPKKNHRKKKSSKLQRQKIKTAKKAATAIKRIYGERKRYHSKGFDIRAIYKKYGIAKIDGAIVKVAKLILKDAKALKKKPSRKMKSAFKKRARQLHKIYRAVKRIRRAITNDVSKMKRRKSNNRKYFRELKNYEKALKKLHANLRKIYKLYYQAIDAGIK